MPMKGKDGHLRRLKRMSGAEVIKAANRVVYVGADMIRGKAYQQISRGSVSGRNHVPAPPGAYPNRDTGHLQANIETANPEPLLATVTSSAEYAAALEFGTSRMAARPYMKPARDSEEPRIRKLFAQEIQKIVKRSGQ